MFEDLEKELGALRPREPVAGLEERIAAGLAREKFSRGDKWLAGVMSGGVAAAILIGVLLVTDNGAGPAASAAPAQAMTIADTPRMLAQLTGDAGSPHWNGPATNPNGGGL